MTKPPEEDMSLEFFEELYSFFRGAETRLARDTSAKPIFAPIIRTRLPQQESQPHHQKVPEVPILMEKIAKKRTMTKPRNRKPQKVRRKKEKSAQQIKKPQEAGANRRRIEKRKETDERESLIELLQGQQEMMTKAEERDLLAMQELIEFEMKAEKRHQDFTLAAERNSEIFSTIE